MFRINSMFSLLLCVCLHTFAQEVYTVDARQTISPVQSTMWGLFYEDINRSGDGGVYADLVKNRSFDFPEAMIGWTTVPSKRQWGKADMFRIVNRSVSHPENPKYLQVILQDGEKVSLSNESFGGMSLKKGAEYEFIIQYKKEGKIKTMLDLVSSSGKTVASINIPLTTADRHQWHSIKQKLITSDTTHNGRLVLTFEGPGTLEIDRISLFPADTWKGRKEGLRSDLVHLLADMKPGFFRFPGGCIVEGENLDNSYRWKTTIGPLENRKLLINKWNNAIPTRQLQDYYQSFGLGFYEYFLLCEDMAAEPMPIINCGISCQFDAGEVVPMEHMDPYVQDALDLIEFANGKVETKWGRKRMELGHPAPFNMKFLGIGNENWGPQYVERLQLFSKAIKEKHPNIQIITSTGYSPNPQFHYMDSALRKMAVDVIDEHYYQTPEWFLMNAGKYDKYDRKGPKILVGEYACHSVRIGSPNNKNTLLCALAEAAFMTGLERNADVVTMAAYAPLFAHVKDWQWTPNLIWFDNNMSYATPSYYVQQLFSVNKGTHVVPLIPGTNPQGDKGISLSGQDSIWASAVIDKQTNELIVKLVNPSGMVKYKKIVVNGNKNVNGKGKMTVLKSNRPDDFYFFEKPETAIVPVTSSIEMKYRTIELKVQPYSFNVMRIKL